ELSTIQVCLAYVDAQREYYSRDRGSGLLEYAQRLESTRGKRDGLYWETKPGERPSPLGPLVGEARAAGYVKPSRASGCPTRAISTGCCWLKVRPRPAEPTTTSSRGT